MGLGLGSEDTEMSSSSVNGGGGGGAGGRPHSRYMNHDAHLTASVVSHDNTM